MWGNKTAVAPPPASAASPALSNSGLAQRGNEPVRPGAPVLRNTAWLGPGIQIKGQISGDEDLQIDGKVDGPITLGGHRLTIGSNAQIESEIVAREVVVHGKVNGDLRARDRIEIRKNGSVVGDLTTARISIEDGAYFKGSIEIDRSNSQVGADLGTLLARSGKKE